MQIVTDALIIKSKPFKSDRVLHLLTPDGVIVAFARGAMNTKNKLTSTSELLCYARFVLQKKNDTYIVTAAEHYRLFFGIRENIEKLSLASYFCSVALSFCPEGEDSREIIRLILNSLHLLENDKRDFDFIKAVFELRLLTLAGYMPSLVCCATCKAHSSACFYFSVHTGEIICEKCKTNSAIVGTEIKASQSTISAMRHIIYSEFEKLFSFNLGKSSLKKLREIAEAYLIYRLEYTPKTLSFYKDICG